MEVSMSKTERLLLWIVAVVAVVLAGYNFIAGRELTGWAQDDLHRWTVHTTGEIAHTVGPPIDHEGPPPPPPW
jgi:hypothetical protein